MAKDYYQILGVEKNVSQDDVKKAYRKLAHEYHPDKKGGSEEKFKEINEAYQVLSDPDKRERYDQFGNSAFSGGGGFEGFSGFGGQNFNDFSNFGFNGGSFDMEDIFDMFGGVFGGRRSGRTRAEVNAGADLEVNINVDFYVSARGGIKKVEIFKENICLNCKGSGARAGSALNNCNICGGSGEIRQASRSIFGNIARIVTCKNCRGSGTIPKENCGSCHGEGRVKGIKILDVSIPGGIRDGEILVVKGQGQAGFRNGESGDLYIKVKVFSDPRFRRINYDIYHDLPLKLTDAILGKVVRIPTLEAEKEIEIPAGVQDGEEIRIKGQGVHGNRRGDLIIKLNVKMPRRLSSRGRKLVEELAREIE